MSKYKNYKFRIKLNEGPYRLTLLPGDCGGWALVIGGLVFSYMGSDVEVLED
jgi:hypothetical protein